MPSAEDAGDTAAESAAGKAGKTKRSGGKKAASDRPKMASLFKTMSPESLTLEDALKLLSLRAKSAPTMRRTPKPAKCKRLRSWPTMAVTART